MCSGVATCPLIDFRPKTHRSHVTSPASDVIRAEKVVWIMSSVHNSVDTVNAAAIAIVAAESRVQPSAVQRRKRGSCWSFCWCFGSYKHSKRIGHALLVSEPTAQVAIAPVEDLNRSAAIGLPFMAPPSSPSSFLQSDPPSATQSPAGLLSLASLSVQSYSPGGNAPIFMIGPYAHETQLVSPPAFSAFTTEPSTASLTPPPEPVHMTTPSSPEVPLARILSSSLACNQKNSWTNPKYEFQPYQYLGSCGLHTKSPDSAASTSGTSSPLPDKRPAIDVSKGEAPKFFGYEHHLLNYKWGSRVGSGSLTPNGWGSRLSSGTLTPSGGLSRLGSGTVTPNGGEPPSRDSNLLEYQISEVALLASSGKDLQNDDHVVDHRVSFELIDEDIPTCTVTEIVPSPKIISGSLHEAIAEATNQKDSLLNNADGCGQPGYAVTVNGVSGRTSDGKREEYHWQHRTTSVGSSRQFNFSNAEGEVSDKSTVDCEWWTNDEVVHKELRPQNNNWTFCPVLQPKVS